MELFFFYMATVYWDWLFLLLLFLGNLRNLDVSVYWVLGSLHFSFWVFASFMKFAVFVFIFFSGVRVGNVRC